MTFVMKSVLSRVLPGWERFIDRHVLGERPDPDHWPEPHDVARLPVPAGIDHADAAPTNSGVLRTGPAWVLGREFLPVWHRRRTGMGAQAYRFTQNEEYDCGWRLVDVAFRFLCARMADHRPGLVVIVPPPPVYTPVRTLEWLAERLARRFDAAYAPELFAAVAPIGAHADRVKRLPVVPRELYEMSGAADLEGRFVLLVDWQWHRGRTITILARKLDRAGARVMRFAWFE